MEKQVRRFLPGDICRRYHPLVLSFVLFITIVIGLGNVTVYASAFLPLRIGLIDRFGNRQVIEINNTSVMLHGHDGSVFLESYSGFTMRPYGGRYVALYDGTGRIRVSDSILLYDGYSGTYAGTITLEGAAFRGGIEFARTSGGITAINLVSVEDYLKSVVPSEMPATWHLEALKAQSVAARTYALFIREHSTHIGFELCNTVCCQVYRGVEWEHENSTFAVLATAGLVLRFNGALIEAVYSASS